MIAHVVEVPERLQSIDLDWPEHALLIFRGTKSAENFCLGADASPVSIASGDFVEGQPSFGELLERVRDSAMPKVVICHGATRGGGMLFPCLGTVVLAHEGATFGFPEIGRGALPGVVSVAARRRLTEAACSWLFCTGDTIDASTAHRLGLVDLVGSWEQLEAEVEHLTEHFLAQEHASIGAPNGPPRLSEALRFEADEQDQVVRLVVGREGAVDLEHTSCALSRTSLSF